MKLTIFGASSLTGTLLVEKGLARGHDITAFVREKSKLEITHPRLDVLCGDALNHKDVDLAIRGSEAVLSTLGPKGKPAVMAAESTKNIMNAMEKNGVKRLILVSVAGIAVPQDRHGKGFVDSLLRFFLKDLFTDRENQLAALLESELDWTVVRVPRLTNENGTGSVKAFYGRPSPAMKLTREDLAEFMLEQLTSDQWLRQAPIVSS